METALAFPEPLPEDPEVVATALETAGIFGVQGDVREAVRWVRRAAELAGDAGIDDRAFALARAAADLTSNFSAPAESSPPPAAPAQSAPSDGAAARIASAPPPPPPPPPVVAQNRPPSQPHESRPPHQAVSVSPIVSLGVRAAQAPAAEDEAEITSQHPPHRGRQADSVPPVQAQPAAQPAPAAPGNDALAALFAEPVAQVNAAAVAPVAARASLQHTIAYQSPPGPESAPATRAELAVEESPTPVPAVAPPEQTVRYPAESARPNFSAPPRHAQSSQHLAATQVYEPVQPEAAFVEEAVPVIEATISAVEPAVAPAPTQDSTRQAARASVEQSQEEGVYILRLLKNGEAAAFGTFEALVVLVDPGAELFTGA